MPKKNSRNTKSKIVDAAWRLFYEQGYDDTTVEDIRALAPFFRKAMEQNNICVVGSAAKIEEDKALFKEVKNLFE